MSEELSALVAAVSDELERIGVVTSEVAIDALDASTYVVTVVSTAFDGQTYLDREMRIRPAVLRALGPLTRGLATFVIEAQTADERADETAETTFPPALFDEEFDGDSERVGRRDWRELRKVVLRALERSQYEVVVLVNDLVYSASRAGLARERILVAFASSPKVTTVDVETRKLLQEARQTNIYAGVYYVTPSPLRAPLANQSAASWLEVCAAVDFLHSLNSSRQLAQRLIDQCALDLTAMSPEQAGPVVEPAVRIDDSILESGFFEEMKRWAATPGASFLVLIAPAGHGKTTLAMELTRRFASRFLTELEHETPVPLFVGFESVRRTVDFEALVYKRFAEIKAGALGAFSELLRLHRAVLLVDGFDELADDAGLAAAEAQIRSMRPFLEGGSKVILAGRSVFTHDFSGSQPIAERIRGLLGDVAVTVVEVLPFADEQIARYVDTRITLAPEARTRVTAFADASPDHADLCGNPLFLRLLCSLSASGKMPDASEVAAGVGALISKVCEREEERQHLGLGIEVQTQFLAWVAQESFRGLIAHGRSWLAKEDVRTIASIVIDVPPDRKEEIVGRLADHALLAVLPPSRLTLIHPFLRDVLLARVIEHEGLSSSVLSLGDLPEGTVDHLAGGLRGDAGRAPLLVGSSWLTSASGLNSRVRRNLFRLAIASARFVRNGNPRDWLPNRGTNQIRIEGIDLSGLVVETASFRGMSFVNCSLESALLDDCDLEGTQFIGSDLRYTLFVNCRLDAASDVVGGQCVHTSIRDGTRLFSFQAAEDFQRWITDKYPRQVDLFAVQLPPPLSADVVARCRELIRAILELMVVHSPAPKFHTINREALDHNSAGLAEQRGEREAIQRVLVPGIVAGLCVSELQGGSRQAVSIDKRFHNAALRFLRDGQVTSGLEQVFARLAAKSARYLD